MEEHQNHNLKGSKQKSGKIQSIYKEEKIKNMGDEIKLIVQEKNLAYKNYHQTETIDNEMEYKHRRATAKREI
jgi:hypothetical protein